LHVIPSSAFIRLTRPRIVRTRLRNRRTAAVAIVAAVLVAALAIPRLPPVRTAALTIGLVPQMLDLGFSPLSLVTGKPSVETTSYGTPADRMDVYVPDGARAGSALPAVVLALGVHPAPIDDASIANIASAIARAGVVVGVPDSSALRQLRVTPAEPAHLADAVLELAARPEVDGSRVGLAGFSAGASIALDAAADPRLSGHLDFVSSFGGYADAERLLVDVASRTTLNADGTVSAWQPDAGIRHDVLELAIQALPDDGQRDALRASLSSVVAADGTPPIVDRVPAFSGDAQHVFELFTAPDRPTAQAAVDALSEALRAQLAGISPTTYAANVHVPVYILHGQADTAIPVAHAALLNDALGTNVERFTEFGEFGHGQPGANGLSLDDLGDVVFLALYLRDVVAAATE
jgi:dienelactone hydrolase